MDRRLLEGAVAPSLAGISLGVKTGQVAVVAARLSPLPHLVLSRRRRELRLVPHVRGRVALALEKIAKSQVSSR
jgi:hypothetical protein